MRIGSLIGKEVPTELWIPGFFQSALYLLVGVSTRFISRPPAIFHVEIICIGKYFSTPLPDVIQQNLDWGKYLTEDGKEWFRELRLNDSSVG